MLELSPAKLLFMLHFQELLPLKDTEYPVLLLI